MLTRKKRKERKKRNEIERDKTKKRVHISPLYVKTEKISPTYIHRFIEQPTEYVRIL